MDAQRIDEQSVKGTPDRAHLDRPTDLVLRERPEWGSDLITHVLRLLGIEYAAVNPGSSFRGLHDSIVNYAGNERPGMILCNHEEVAVAIAHGYAKASGRPMAAIVHSNVGLMHASMAIYNAWADRSPVLVIGATGPMDAAQRRPWIDWIHTAHTQGQIVRDFTKWEHQPASIDSIPEAMLRAWHAALSRPQGPVYVCFDAGLQEQRLGASVSVPTPEQIARYPVPEPPEAPDEVLDRAAEVLFGASSPVILLGNIGRIDQTWNDLISLAEVLGAAVVTDIKSPAAFPTDHPLQQAWPSGKVNEESAEVLRAADVVLALERISVAGTLRTAATGVAGSPGFALNASPARLINVSLEQYALHSWSYDFQELPAADVPIVADVGRVVPALLERIQKLMTDHPAGMERARERTGAHEARRRRLEEKWEASRLERWNETPISLVRMVGQLSEALGNGHSDVVLAHVPLKWPKGAWHFRSPNSYLGYDGGGGIGSGPGISVGAALATLGSGRMVVSIVGDGDLLMAPTALWTAAHHNIPLLMVVANNRSYYNDEEHQERVAQARGRPVENKWIGQRMDEPAVDFAGLARDLGVEGLGPVFDPVDLADVYRRAISVVAEERRPVLVDVRIAPGE